jgi:apolipoprotein N-acyltransferase
VLPRAARVAAGALRGVARMGLLWMIAAVLLGDATLQSNTLAQVRSFVALFLVPEAAAWCVLRAFAARAAIVDGRLVLTSGSRRLELALSDIAAAQPWRVPIPEPGLSLVLVSGERWPHGIAFARPDALARALAPASDAAARQQAASTVDRYAHVIEAPRRGRLGHPFVKFGLFPLLLAIPAFRLHQHIAYGGTFGEYLTFGWQAYLTTFALWWAAWTVGVVLCAAALRTAIEAGTLAGVVLAPARAVDARHALETLGLAVLYLGLPAWLLAHMLGA